MSRGEERLPFFEHAPGPGYERLIVRLRRGDAVPYQPAAWRGALIGVACGQIECVGSHGSRRTFWVGSLLWADGLPLAALSNPGPGTTVLVAVRRRRALSTGADSSSARPSSVQASGHHLGGRQRSRSMEMSDQHDIQREGGAAPAAGAPDVPARNADLDGLDRLVGTWRLTGGAEGTVRYEWMEGRFFLLQHVDLVQYGQLIRGLEIIGHLRPFGEEESPEIRSRFYDTQGNTLDYVYQVDGDVLTIWGGEKGSPAFYKGTFSPDGNSADGEWVYPGGGGYPSTMTRIDP